VSLSVTPLQLFEPTVLTTAAATLFTCNAGVASNVLYNGRMRVTNTTNAPVTVTLYAVKVGGTAGAANCFANAESVAANAHTDYDIPQLAAGDFLQALASANTSITAFSLSGTVLST
jgi:hypothetical protein